MAITSEMQRELAKKARAANRRLERASEGQRRALEYYIRGYAVRQRGEYIIFQQGKAKSEAEYKKRMQELEDFMQAESSTKKGWKALKERQVRAAGETLRDEGSNLTDDELANVLIELNRDGDSKGGSDVIFQAAVQNVEIAKRKAGKNWTGSDQQIRDAINSRRSAQERVQTLLKLRRAEKAKTERAAKRKIKKLVAEVRNKRR